MIFAQNDMNKTDISVLSKGSYFIENKGQWPDEVLFMANTKSLRAWITTKGMVFEQYEKITKLELDNLADRKIASYSVAIEYVNSANFTARELDEGTIKYNYLLGNFKSKHSHGVKQYEEVVLENVYDGIDIRFYIDNGELRYDFIVHPFSDPKLIELAINGSMGNELINNELIINTNLKPIVHKELSAYQNSNSSNSKQAVSASFNLDGNNLSFNIGDYDKSKPLIIDPIVQTKLDVIQGDNNSTDVLMDLEFYHIRQVYICGYTNAIDFPVTIGSNYGGFDVIIGSIDYENDSTNWLTFLGGNEDDYGLSIDVTSNGVYLTGTTKSGNFPLQFELYLNIEDSQSNFFTLLNTSDGSLLYSTYLGNSSTNMSLGKIKVFDEGKVLLSGEAGTDQTNSFTEYKPITTQSRISNLNTQVAFLMCLEEVSPLNYGFVFSSLFGGDTLTEIRDIEVDTSGNIYLTGITLSTDASFDPTTNAYDVLNHKNERTNFVTKLHLGSTNLGIDYNSFYGNLGNDDYEGSHAIYVYKDTVYIGGYSTLDSIPQKRATDSIFSAPDYEAFVAAFVFNSTTVNDLIYSSYMGGDYNSLIKDLSFDEFCNHLLFVGSTNGEIDDYFGHIYEPFNGNNSFSDVMVGALNFNNIYNVVLDELAYVSGSIDCYGNALRYDPPSKMIFTCGIYQSITDLDMLLINLSKSYCTALKCPCPESSDFWLNVVAANREGFCDSNECFVSHYLEVPEFYANCFEFVQLSSSIDSNYYITPTIISLDTFDILNYDFCIASGEYYEISLSFMRNITDEEPCIITNGTFCNPSTYIEPCYPDWPQNVWIIDTTIFTFSFCPNCIVTVQYAYRIVTYASDRQDLQIMKFELLGTGCDDCDIEDIYRNSIAKLLYDNRMEFLLIYDNTINDTCMFIDRVALGGCFGRWEYYIYTGMTHIDTVIMWESCLDTFCCWQAIVACPDSLNGFIIATQGDGSYGPQGLCEETTIVSPYDQLLQCIMACNWNANLPGYYEFPGTTQKRSYILPDINSSNSFGIRVFNFGNTLNLQLRANQQARASFSIYDLTGRLVKSYDLYCKSGENAYNFDITDLANGIFIYAIEINGLLIKSDKLLKY